MQSSRARRWAISALFFCSGATALVYEVVWSKYLSQMFGSTIQAQTVVLAVFMGGLALGNFLLSRKVDRLTRPLRAYGYVEASIGLYAFFFPTLFALADGIFISVGSRVLGHPFSLLGLKAVLSLGLLLAPTALMGSTLPLMAAWLQQSSTEPGQHSARFYSINSLGAVVGAALAGFYLVQTWGMVAALQLTALVNIIIGASAALAGRTPETSIIAPESCVSREGSHAILKSAGLMVALSGGVSMGMEVLASRSLSLIFGSSLQSFAIVLIAFIIGIGLGSAVMASERARRWRTECVLIVLLLSATVWVGLLVWRIDQWVDVYRVLQAGISRTNVGYIYHELLAAILAMVMLGIPAALSGSVLPLLIRLLGEKNANLGGSVGRLLTWNTLGGVFGVLVTGFILMPGLGLRNSFLILILVLCALAGWIAWRSQMHAGTGSSITVAALVGFFFVFGGEGWRHVMSSGVFRARETEVNMDVMRQRKEHIKILFYEDAADATVSVEQGDGIGAPADLGLRINGKADASTRGDLCTQLLLGHLPMLARPNSQDVFLLGLGSGITGAAITTHPIRRLIIAENCEPVIRAAQLFGPWNRGVLTNPVTTIWPEDARTILKLSPQKYDVIITEPSNPWMVGVGSVFSREYYELAASRLKEGGIIAQWFHLYDMHDGIVALVLRTFTSVFPHMEIWDCGAGDIVLLGSQKPWVSSPETYARGFELELPRKDLERIGIRSPSALLARQLASQRTAFAIPNEGAIQSDLFPVLEYEAPRAFYMGNTSRMLSQFDERTHQADLCPPGKRAILAGLDDATLRALFSDYSSVNEELLNQIAFRLDQPASAPRVQAILSTTSVPSVFLKAAPEPSPPKGHEAHGELQRLARAATVIASNSPERKEAIQTIEQLLRDYNDQSNWSTAYFGAVAARASLSEGNVESARRILELARKHARDESQLLYLSRIVEREGALNVKKLSSVKP